MAAEAHHIIQCLYANEAFLYVLVYNPGKQSNWSAQYRQTFLARHDITARVDGTCWWSAHTWYWGRIGSFLPYLGQDDRVQKNKATCFTIGLTVCKSCPQSAKEEIRRQNLNCHGISGVGPSEMPPTQTKLFDRNAESWNTQTSFNSCLISCRHGQSNGASILILLTVQTRDANGSQNDGIL